LYNYPNYDINSFNKKYLFSGENIMTDTLTRNRKIALTGALSALVIVLGITKLGLIPIGAVASI
jgi:hypothetical protein